MVKQMHVWMSGSADKCCSQSGAVRFFGICGMHLNVNVNSRLTRNWQRILANWLEDGLWEDV